MNDVIGANEQYITALEKSNSTKDVMDAMIEHGNKMETLAAKGEKIEKKYPELKLMDKKKLPVELKEESDKLEQTVQKRLTVSMKMMKYMMAPEVMKASQEMTKKMGKSWILNK
jgi:methyltransferase-like protein